MSKFTDILKSRLWLVLIIVGFIGEAIAIWWQEYDLKVGSWLEIAFFLCIAAGVCIQITFWYLSISKPQAPTTLKKT